MKRYIAAAIAVALLLCLFTGCAPAQADGSGMVTHTIGVATYNIKDAQVMMFKDYLDNYITQCFPDTTFVYSDSISNAEEMMDFLSRCAERGVEGIMAFNSYDLPQEVAFCQEKGMYLIRPASNSADEVFAAVESNPYYIGEIGPGSAAEYEQAAAMTRAMVQPDGSYIILSGGAFMGNEMHRQRTVAMLDTLQEQTGVTLAQGSEALALVSEPTQIQEGSLKLLICPGYVELEQFGAPADAAIRSGEYTTVLASIPVTPLMDALNASTVICGVIDCFSEDNYFGFVKEKIGYVAGKYQAEIGPAFAALYNAITGYADDYRVDGKAFRLEQGFWTAANRAEYEQKFALASAVAVNAYNHEDLSSLAKSLNPDANFASFQAMVEAWSYEDCLARRAG